MSPRMAHLKMDHNTTALKITASVLMHYLMWKMSLHLQVPSHIKLVQICTLESSFHRYFMKFRPKWNRHMECD